MPVDSALAALFPGPASGSGDDELECLSFLPVLPRRGLPRTGSIHAGLNRGARQWDLKSRYLCLERAGKPRSEEVLEEDSSEDESWDMTDKNCLAAPSLMDLPMHAGRRPCSDGREDGAHVAHRLIEVHDMHLDEPLSSSGCASARSREPTRVAHSPHVLPLKSQSLPGSPLSAPRRRASRPFNACTSTDNTSSSTPTETRKRAADAEDIEGVRDHFKRFAICADVTSATLPMGPLPERVE